MQQSVPKEVPKKMRYGYSIRWWMALLCFLAVTVMPSFGQVDIGSISGTVVDATDFVVPGVRITVRNEDTRATQETTTNSSGYFISPSLMVGDYTVIVEMKGFRRFVQTGIHLNAADHLSVPVRLSLGEVTQSVQVSSGAFSINGGRTDAYTVYVDGAVATRTRSSGSMLGAQDMSSVQELQVLTGYFDAEYGRSNGRQIRFVTKSGT